MGRPLSSGRVWSSALTETSLLVGLELHASWELG